MKKPILLLLAGVLLAGVTNVAHAQRERPSRDERRETFANQLESMTPQQRIQFFENRFNERLQTASPEQRERMMAMRAQFEQRIKDAGVDLNSPDAWNQIQKSGVLQGMADQLGQNDGRGGRGNRTERAAADAMKQMMEAAGITNFDIQDAVIAYVNEQNKARVTLLQLAQTTARALQEPVVEPINAADTNVRETANDKVATSFSAYETAVQAENERQQKALEELDEKIHYSTTPRIKAFLTLVGILNNDVLAIGGPTAIFTTPRQNGDPRQAGTDGQERGRGNRNRG